MHWNDSHMQQAKAHHTVCFLFLLAAGVLAGCANTESPSSQSEIANAASPLQSLEPNAVVPTLDPASGAFQRVWQAQLSPNLTKHQQQATIGLDAPIRSGKSLVSRQMPFRDCILRVNDSVTEDEREWRILYGEVSDLDRDGRGWEVVADPYPGRGNCVVAYFDNDLNLLLAWIGLEG